MANWLFDKSPLSHYSYSQSEADKIVNALSSEVKNIREKFNSKNSRETKEFKL